MDKRTPIERRLDEMVGPPLYYCADCLRAVSVTPVEGDEPIIERPCNEECGPQIMAPRKAIVAGKGGLSFPDKTRMAVAQILAAVTGRCV